jgi:lipopolysaccharide transport system ATP-binding protein
VLAVGDAEFQKKCLGKMGDITAKDGRTVLFVSHNLAAVKSLCTKGIVLENAFIKYIGTAERSVTNYLSGSSESLNNKKFVDEFETEILNVNEISISPKGLNYDEILNEFHEIQLTTLVTIKSHPERLHLTYVLKDEEGKALFTFSTSGIVPLTLGQNKLICSFPKGFLNIGNYYIDLYLIEDALRAIFHESDIMAFTIQEGPRALGGWMGKEPGFIKPVFDWVNL